MKNLPTYEEFINESRINEMMDSKALTKEKKLDKLASSYDSSDPMKMGVTFTVVDVDYLEEILDVDGNSFLEAGDQYKILGYINKAGGETYVKLECLKGSAKGQIVFVEAEEGMMGYEEWAKIKK